jgi:two-component system, chemotaxis family, sensor kinase Cph1
MNKKPDLPTNVEKLRHKLDSLRSSANAAPERSDLANFSAGLTSALDELQRQADELILAKESAESESRKYYELFEGAPDGYIVTDTKGQIMEANKAAGEMLSVPPENLIGKPFSHFIERDSRIESDKKLEYLLTSKKSIIQNLELRLIPREHVPFHASLTIAITTDTKNEPTGLRWLIHDITERKLAEVELASTVTRLAQSNAEIERFAYAAAHDLKEPLRTVSTYMQLLKRDEKSNLSQDGTEILATISDSVSKMISLVDGLLMYSSATSTDGKLEISKVPLSEAVSEAIDFNLIVIKAAGAKVTVGDIPDELVPQAQFVLVLRNLISNAIKFRRKTAPLVIIEFKQSEQGCVCSIKDNGIGIQKKYADKIFDMFQRLHSDIDYSGNGIGLAVCKKVVDHWGGKIWVESEYGKGATFSFNLPATKATNSVRS